MNGIWVALTNSIENGNYWSVSIVIIVLVIFNVQNIYNFINNGIQRKKAKLIEEALQSGNISEDFKDFMRDELECEYFRQLTGIKTDNSLIINLVKLHKYVAGAFSFDKINTALPHMNSINGFEVFANSSLKCNFTS